MIKLKSILLGEQEDPSYDELSGKEKNDIKAAVKEVLKAIRKYAKPGRHYWDKESKIEFSDGSIWVVPYRSRFDAEKIQLKHPKTGEKKYVYHASSENGRENWFHNVHDKKKDTWSYPVLGWPEKIYGGYLGGKTYYDEEHAKQQGYFPQPWPKFDYGKWQPNELVWTRDGGLTQKFIDNEPENEWDCQYGKLKRYADNEISDKYPNGVWDEIYDPYDRNRADFFDPKLCDYKGYKID
tara:strand:- start:118 stop:831 length:714 start_codon:yes stop_codon:yes gene_type:complete